MENFLLCSRTLYDKDLLDKSHEISNLKNIMSIMIDNLDHEKIFDMAYECLGKKKIEESIYFFNQVLEKCEDSHYIYRAYSYLGRCYAYKNNWDQSIKFHQKAIDISGFQEFTYFGLAHAYFYMGEYDQGISICKIIIENIPENKESYIIMGGLYTLTKQTKLAIETYKKALELFPGNEHLIKALEKHK